METDKVIQDLNCRFAAPLPKFYQHRIIFWYDEDKEFEHKLAINNWYASTLEILLRYDRNYFLGANSNIVQNWNTRGMLFYTIQTIKNSMVCA